MNIELYQNYKTKQLVIYILASHKHASDFFKEASEEDVYRKTFNFNDPNLAEHIFDWLINSGVTTQQAKSIINQLGQGIIDIIEGKNEVLQLIEYPLQMD